MVLGDFNLEPSDIALVSLIQDHGLYNMIKHPTCLKSSKGSCIDLIFTIRKHSFMHSKSFETGFSDHHHMIYIILKTTYIKLPPKKVIYRNYKNWSHLQFEDEMRRKLTLSHPSVYRNFESIFVNALEKNAPTKTRIVRVNNKPHGTKELRRAMSRRSRLKNITKSNREEDIRKYKDQRNLVVRLNLQAKKQHFMSIKAKTVDNDRKLCTTVKPLFSYRNPVSEKINLIENEKFLSTDEEIQECFSNYFTNIKDNLDIDPYFKEDPHPLIIEEMVMRAIEKYKDHPSIRVIKQHADGNTFKFSHVNLTEVMKQIDLLDSKKSSSGNIPTDILKGTKELICPYLTDCINSANYDCKFPDEMKIAELIPVHKNDDSNLKENYRAISVLPAVSNVYESFLKDQISPYFHEILSNILCDFRA